MAGANPSTWIGPVWPNGQIHSQPPPQTGLSWAHCLSSLLSSSLQSPVLRKLGQCEASLSGQLCGVSGSAQVTSCFFTGMIHSMFVTSLGQCKRYASSQGHNWIAPLRSLSLNWGRHTNTPTCWNKSFPIGKHVNKKLCSLAFSLICGFLHAERFCEQKGSDTVLLSTVAHNFLMVQVWISVSSLWLPLPTGQKALF